MRDSRPHATSDTDDHTLLEQWRAGDAVAGDELVCRHFDRVHGFFFRKVDVAVEDLTQLVFLRALEHADRLSAAASFPAYLMGIARKVLYEHLRAKGRGTPPELGVFFEDRFGGSPSQGAALREGERQLLRALRKLPLEHQITLELFFWEGLCIQEIAEVLDVAPGTVKSRLHRAKGLLREALHEAERSGTFFRSTKDQLSRWIARVRAAMSVSRPTVK